MLLSMMLIGFALTLIGCKGKQVVTETVRTEYIDRYVHDTIRIGNLTQIIDSVRVSVTESVKDCVVIVKDTSGNVINKELSHSKETVDSVAYYRSIIDSLRRIKNDNTIYTEKAKEASLWDSIKNEIKQRICGLLHIVIAAVIIYLIWYVKRKDRQNI